MNFKIAASEDFTPPESAQLYEKRGLYCFLSCHRILYEAMRRSISAIWILLIIKHVKL